MIGIKFDKNRSFFDRVPVLNALDEGTRNALATGGARIRQTARRSMRSRKKASEPGQPPSAHRQDELHPRGPLLKDRLYFAYDHAERSVVVGPEQLGGSGSPERLEKGGQVRIRRRAPRPPGRKATRKQLAAFRRKLKDKTLARPSKAPELVSVTVYVASRPFMIPALNIEKPGLPGAFADTVRLK